MTGRLIATGMARIVTLYDHQGKTPLVEVTMNAGKAKKAPYFKIWLPGRVREGEPSLSIEIATGEPISGSGQATEFRGTLAAVKKWTSKHRDELMAAWDEVYVKQGSLSTKVGGDWVDKATSAAALRGLSSVSVEAFSDHTMLVTFSNGEKRTVDFSDLPLECPNSPLCNPEVFSRAFVRDGFVTWKEADLEFLAEELYLYGTPV